MPTLQPRGLDLTRRQLLTSMFGVGLLLRHNHLLADNVVTELKPRAIPGDVADLEITFSAIDLASDRHTAFDLVHINDRHSPWSTFKIPNLIIALETGVAIGLDHRRRWDPRRYPQRPHWPKDWSQDQSLKTAFKRSVPWYFQEIARDVGTDRYRRYLTSFDYGNSDVQDNKDDFWLGGSLRISVFEHMTFIKRLIGGAFAIKPDKWNALRKVCLIGSASEHRLYGKTGAGPLRPHEIAAPFEGWLVGWIERSKTPSAAFALHVIGPDYRSIRAARLMIAVRLLKASNLLPAAY